MLANQRYQLIGSILKRDRTASTIDLADKLEVSAETIRRDLVYLERQGKLVRIHGGAVALGGDLPQEAPYLERLSVNEAGKTQIGQLAATLVKQHQTIVIDLGTTALKVAAALPEDFEGVVVTNSLLVANVLGERSKAEVRMAPGTLRRGDMCVSGISTYRYFESFYADLAFLGVGAVHYSRGITDFYPEECEIKQSIIRHSRYTYVLADDLKLGNTARYEVCNLDQVTGLITNQTPEVELTSALSRAGCELICPKN